MLGLPTRERFVDQFTGLVDASQERRSGQARRCKKGQGGVISPPAGCCKDMVLCAVGHPTVLAMCRGNDKKVPNKC